MIEVRTGSRLHFGLLNPGMAGPGERRFGGAGMMIDEPGLCVRVEPADAWTSDGPLAERALGFARRFCESLTAETGMTVPPHRIAVVAAPPDHIGLGTGTQLGLAVARAFSVAIGRTDLSAAALAALVGRGLRSAIGVHGFAEGGFLIDGGVAAGTSVAPLIAWHSFPAEWRVLLILPETRGRWHGPQERLVFEKLAENPNDLRRDRLCRLLVTGLLPALVERNLDGFGEALHEFNVLAGEPFAALQGGRFSSPQAAEAVALLRSLGIHGAGQSSWGPAVFGMTLAEHAPWLLARLRQEQRAGTVSIARGCNDSATVS